jgi:hypothetical protein
LRLQTRNLRLKLFPAFFKRRVEFAESIRIQFFLLIQIVGALNLFPGALQFLLLDGNQSFLLIGRFVGTFEIMGDGLG